MENSNSSPILPHSVTNLPHSPFTLPHFSQPHQVSLLIPFSHSIQSESSSLPPHPLTSSPSIPPSYPSLPSLSTPSHIGHTISSPLPPPLLVPPSSFTLPTHISTFSSDTSPTVPHFSPSTSPFHPISLPMIVSPSMSSVSHSSMHHAGIPLVVDLSIPQTTHGISSCSTSIPLVVDPPFSSTTSPIIPTPHHSMQTRSKNNIFKPNKFFAHTSTKHPLLPGPEPTTITQAMQHQEWRDAMHEELQALTSNNTWELVPRQPHHNVVGCKWVFRIKRHPNGTIARYKARLVAKGFHQRPGLDYHETFSPVIKPTTIRIVLTIALSRGWSVHQLDVNNAFLHGNLDEEVFMSQPPGFIDPSRPHHVCRLQKSLYGLKQAPRAWFTELTTFLLSLGFKASRSDSSLFIHSHNSNLAYFLVYVDDLLITGNSSSFIHHVITALSHKFSVKDLGLLNFFLGVEVQPSPNGFILSQQKYIRELLQRFHLDDIKCSSTPLSSTTRLTQNDGSPSADASQYRSLIGSLQYLSISRPDVAYAINKLAQYMHAPSQTHWTAAKRLLRYLKHTINYGLLLRRCHSLHLTAYSDADWAGNRDDCTSISAYVLFLGDNPISWCSKKQRTVARSSTEAEYRSVASAAAEISWVTNLLKELCISLPKPPRLLCDNIGVTYLCANPVFHSKMKHIALDYHFVREKVTSGSLQVAHVSTHHQVADILTKPLPKSRFLFFRSKIGVSDSNTILRGHIKEESIPSTTQASSSINSYV